MLLLFFSAAGILEFRRRFPNWADTKHQLGKHQGHSELISLHGDTHQNLLPGALKCYFMLFPCPVFAPWQVDLRAQNSGKNFSS